MFVVRRVRVGGFEGVRVKVSLEATESVSGMRGQSGVESLACDEMNGYILRANLDSSKRFGIA